VSFKLTRLGPADRDLFEAAYRLLDAEFGHKGELENKAVLERFLCDDRYHFLVVTDAAGTVCAVRDCHLRLDGNRSLVTLYMAHALVVPAHRRQGLGRALREYAEVVALSAPATHHVLCAEMEAGNPNLATYTGAGFRVLDPSLLDYRQPDFRGGNEPVPLRLLIRWLENERAAALPQAICGGVLDALYSIFSTHCDATHLQMLSPSSDVLLLP
jgi:GNAT superfamily N-acetyltransferase